MKINTNETVTANVAEDVKETLRLLNEAIALLDKAKCYMVTEESDQLEDVIDALRKTIHEIR